VLGWRPTWRLDQALERTVAWYKAHGTGADMRAFTLKQIDEYLDG
jgi:CDP-glucose 4,6-dehydratase